MGVSDIQRLLNFIMKQSLTYQATTIGLLLVAILRNFYKFVILKVMSFTDGFGLKLEPNWTWKALWISEVLAILPWL